MSLRTDLLCFIEQRAPLPLSDIRAAFTHVKARGHVLATIRALRESGEIRLDTSGNYVHQPAASGSTPAADTLEGDIVAVVRRHGPIESDDVRDRLTVASACRFAAAVRSLVAARQLAYTRGGLRVVESRP